MADSRFWLMRMRYKRTLERADAFFAEVAAEQPQNLQCGRGCSFCCYGLFEIGSAEQAAPERKGPEVPSRSGSRTVKEILPIRTPVKATLVRVPLSQGANPAAVRRNL